MEFDYVKTVNEIRDYYDIHGTPDYESFEEMLSKWEDEECYKIAINAFIQSDKPLSLNDIYIDDKDGGKFMDWSVYSLSISQNLITGENDFGYIEKDGKFEKLQVKPELIHSEVELNDILDEFFLLAKLAVLLNHKAQFETTVDNYRELALLGENISYSILHNFYPEYEHRHYDSENTNLDLYYLDDGELKHIPPHETSSSVILNLLINSKEEAPYLGYKVHQALCPLITENYVLMFQTLAPIMQTISGEAIHSMSEKLQNVHKFISERQEVELQPVKKKNKGLGLG